MRTILTVVMCLGASPLLAQPCKPIAFEPLPATIVWTARAPAVDAALAEPTLILETKSTIVAIDASSGVKRWETSIAQKDSSGRMDPMVVTNGRVFVNLGRSLRVFETADGRVVRNVAMSRCRAGCACSKGRR